MCVAGAKLVAVGWGVDDSLRNHGTLCGATIRTIYGHFDDNRSEALSGVIRMKE